MVSFELSEDQKLLQETVAAFAVEQMRPLARDADERGAAPESVVAKAWELGLVASAIPESYGGFGDAPSALTGAIVLEELGYGDLSIALHVLAPRLLVYPLLEHGTEEQKKRFLPAFTRREFRAATAAVVEPSLQFDLSALTTTATQETNGFVLLGRKAFVPLAEGSETVLVYARRNERRQPENPAEGYRAVDAFLVDRGSAGLEIGPPEKNMGIRALRSHELALNDVRMRAEHRLGEGHGIDFARLMNRSRVALGALAVRVAPASFHYQRHSA